MSLPLAGKVAIVTGSSLGIGAAIVRRLAADGASGVINYVSSADAAQALADEINKEGKGSAIIVQGNMSSVEDGKRVVEKTVEHFGRIDILVLNAARSVDSPLEAFTEEDFDKHFAVNVKVPLVQVQTASKYLKAGGRVIFISSNLTKLSTVNRNTLLYTGSKGAVNQLIRVLAQDLGTRGITVNAVAPGATATPLFLRTYPQEIIDRIASTYPAKRLGQPEEIAPVVAFLARDEANWVNGQTIYANNGVAV